MFGFQFIKFQPNVYAIRYSNGKVVREGTGLSFFYYAPTTSLAAIPLSSIETPFIFEEVTADYQAITIQGQITYRITEPVKISRFLNFTLDRSGRSYASEDPQKLSQRIVNTVQVLTKKQVLNLTLRDALKSVDAIVDQILAALKENKEIASLGIEILNLAVLAIRPNQETARALEAEAREQILKEADDAIYRRRNASVEQERRIKENELNTEIAVENKKRQIREAQLEADEAVQQKQHQLQASEMEFSIRQEDERKKLVELNLQNARAEADAKGYALARILEAYEDIEPATLQALAGLGMNSSQLIGLSFTKLAERAEKIGELNISPDLLRELMAAPSKPK
jgi:hypothetical protein